MKDFGLTKVEELFRYALTGVVFCLLLLVKYPGVVYHFKAVPVSYTFFAVFASGMVIYAFYRVVLWTVLELILFLCGCSASSTFRNKKQDRRWLSFSKCYGRFLKARYSEHNTKGFEYLYYRWALTHFSLLSTLLYFLFRRLPEPQRGSPFDRVHDVLFDPSSSIHWWLAALLVLAFLDLIHMYSAEKEMFRCTREEDPADTGNTSIQAKPARSPWVGRMKGTFYFFRKPECPL